MIDLKNTSLSFRRPLNDYSKVRKLIGSAVRNTKFQIDRAHIRTLSYLNVGCGPNIHKDFINLDYEWRPGLDICWNIRKKIPLEDSSLSGIFSEHCLEHITLEETRRVVGEFFRLLKPGGVARVSVPDGGLYLNIYAQRELSTNEDSTRDLKNFPYEETDRESGIYSPIVSVNRIAREHGHLYLYDFHILKSIFENSGFVNVTQTGYLQGQDPVLLIDSEHRAVESLYVEAIAP